MQYIPVRKMHELSPFLKARTNGTDSESEYYSFCIKPNLAMRYEPNLSHADLLLHKKQVKLLLKAVYTVFDLYQKQISYIIPEENGRYFFHAFPYANIMKRINRRRCISTQNKKMINTFIEKSFLPSVFELAFSSSDFTITAVPTDHMDIFFYIHSKSPMDYDKKLTFKQEMSKIGLLFITDQ